MNTLGLITPQINRLDLNGCIGCTRGIGDARSDAIAVLSAMSKKFASLQAGQTSVLFVGGSGANSISNTERLAVNDALYELDSPSSFSTTSSYGGGTVVGNPTSIPTLKAEIDAALRSAGVTPPSSKPAWLMPVLIGGGVLVAGGIVFALLRRK